MVIPDVFENKSCWYNVLYNDGNENKYDQVYAENQIEAASEVYQTCFGAKKIIVISVEES